MKIYSGARSEEVPRRPLDRGCIDGDIPRCPSSRHTAAGGPVRIHVHTGPQGLLPGPGRDRDALSQRHGPRSGHHRGAAGREMGGIRGQAQQGRGRCRQEPAETQEQDLRRFGRTLVPRRADGSGFLPYPGRRRDGRPDRMPRAVTGPEAPLIPNSPCGRVLPLYAERHRRRTSSRHRRDRPNRRPRSPR